MKMKTLLSVTVAAVLLCLLISFFYTDSGERDGPENDLVGEWTIYDAVCGGYTAGEPDFSDYSVKEKDVSIQPREDGFYDIKIFDRDIIGALDDDVLMSSLPNSFSRLFFYAEGDRMSVSLLDTDFALAISMKLVRNGANADDTILRGSSATSQWQIGSYEALEAKKITKDDVVDVLSSDTTMEVLQIEDGVVFYESRDPYSDMLFASVQIKADRWVSIAYIDEEFYWTDSVIMDGGSIRTFSFDEEEHAMWYTLYGEKTEDVDIDLAGMSFTGIEQSILVYGGGAIREFHNIGSIEVLEQDGSKIVLGSEFTDGKDLIKTEWYGVIVKDGDGYSATFQTYFVYDGYVFYGDCFVTLDKDLKRIVINGVADGYDGYMVLNQVYGKGAPESVPNEFLPF